MTESLDFYLNQLRLSKDADNVDSLLLKLSNDNDGKMDPRTAVCEVLAEIFKTRWAKKTTTWLTTAGFPKLLAGKTFNTKQGNLPIDQAESFLECDWIERHENMLISDPAGIGKTHFSVAIGKRAIAKGYRTKFSSATNLFKILSKAEETSPVLFEKKFQHLLAQDLLIIDDMGNGAYPPKAVEYLYMLMDMRSQRALSTIITTNSSIKDWSEKLGNPHNLRAGLDRFLEQAHWIKFQGKSLRLASFYKRNKIKGGQSFEEMSNA